MTLNRWEVLLTALGLAAVLYQPALAAPNGPKEVVLHFGAIGLWNTNCHGGKNGSFSVQFESSSPEQGDDPKTDYAVQPANIFVAELGVTKMFGGNVVSASVTGDTLTMGLVEQGAPDNAPPTSMMTWQKQPGGKMLMSGSAMANFTKSTALLTLCRKITGPGAYQ